MLYRNNLPVDHSVDEHLRSPWARRFAAMACRSEGYSRHPIRLLRRVLLLIHSDALSARIQPGYVRCCTHSCVRERVCYHKAINCQSLKNVTRLGPAIVQESDSSPTSDILIADTFPNIAGATARRLTAGVRMRNTHNGTGRCSPALQRPLSTVSTGFGVSPEEPSCG